MDCSNVRQLNAVRQADAIPSLEGNTVQMYKEMIQSQQGLYETPKTDDYSDKIQQELAINDYQMALKCLSSFGKNNDKHLSHIGTDDVSFDSINNVVLSTDKAGKDSEINVKNEALNNFETTDDER